MFDLLVLVAFVFCIRLLLPWIIFQPTSEILRVPGAYGMPFENVTLTTAVHVQLNGWFVPAQKARGTLLFFHGNAGNISGCTAPIEIYLDLGLTVLHIDH